MMTTSDLEHISKQESRRLMALRHRQREARINMQSSSWLWAQYRFIALINQLPEVSHG